MTSDEARDRDDEPIPELRDLQVDPPEAFEDRLWRSLSHHELRRQSLDLSLAMIGHVIASYARALADVLFRRSPNDKKGDR